MDIERIIERKNTAKAKKRRAIKERDWKLYISLGESCKSCFHLITHNCQGMDLAKICKSWFSPLKPEKNEKMDKILGRNDNKNVHLFALITS